MAQGEYVHDSALYIMYGIIDRSSLIKSKWLRQLILAPL